MYDCKVVWIGTTLGDSSVADFEKFFLDELGFHIKYDEEFKMLDGFYKGLNCIIFGVCGKEIPKFSLFRITTPDMKWIEDLKDNEEGNIPEYIVDKY